MGKKKRTKSDFRISSSLPSRSRSRNIEYLGYNFEHGPPVQVDHDRVHQALRELKARAIEIKATFKKNEKKKKTTGIDEVKCLAKNLESQLHELFQLLGIKGENTDSRRHSGSAGRRRSIDDIQLQLQDRSTAQDPNACHKCKQLEEWNKQITKNEQEALTRCKQLEERNKKLTSEKDEALTRLSQIAGSKLRENNPAIADLSDPNRPMKLSEKVSELYDNEWTETAESLEKFNENIQYVSLLRDIFIESYKYCMEAAEKQLNAIYQLITYSRRHQHSSHVISLSTYVREKCKEFRKSIAETSISSFDLQARLWYYVQDKQGDAVATICSDYIGKCMKYSWYMCIQDPPIHMEYDYKEGDKFVPDLMRAYTKTGPCIEFLVWPALHLHRNGPLLSKAIVQGLNIQKKDPPTPKVTENTDVRYGERQRSYQPLVMTPVSYHGEQKYDVQISGSRDCMDSRKRQVPTYNDNYQKLDPAVHKSNQDHHNKLDLAVYKSNQDHHQTLDPAVYKSNQDHHQKLDPAVRKSNQAGYHDQRQQKFSQTYHISSGRSHHHRNTETAATSGYGQQSEQSRAPNMHQTSNINQNYHSVSYHQAQRTAHETVI